MMDLKMEVYTPALELVGILEVHRSIIWEEKAFGAGSFSVDALITQESKALLIPDNIIWIAGETAGIIEYVQEQSGKDGPYITVKGPDLTGILEQRILWGQYNLTGTAPSIMHSLVNDCCISPTRGDTEARKIPGLISLDVPTGGDAIRVQKTGGTLLEALEELGVAFGVAFGVRFNPAVPRMEFWTCWGQNRSVNQDTNDPVFYSTELDDVLSSEYSYNAQDYRNVALVAGEGEGGNRVMITVNADVTPAPIPPTPGTKYTIILSVDPEGGGVATGGGQINEGENVTVIATPSSGYTFSAWQENGQTVSTSVSYTFTVNANRNLTAVFATVIPTYTITATIDPDGSGTVTGAGQYQEGQTVTLVATPSDGYKFTGWREGSETVSTDTTYSFTVTGDRTFVGVFAVASKLPDGYTEIEYIQSGNGQYIDTGVKPTSSTRLKMDVEPLRSYTAANGVYFFDSHYWKTTTPKAFYYMYAWWTTGGISAALGYYDSPFNGTVIDSNKLPRRIKIQADAANRVVSADGTSKSFPNNTMSALMTNITLLSQGTSFPLSAKLYSSEIYDNNDLIRKFVPCINPSGIAGLYDLIGNVFYSSSNSTNFTAGPAV